MIKLANKFSLKSTIAGLLMIFGLISCSLVGLLGFLTAESGVRDGVTRELRQTLELKRDEMTQLAAKMDDSIRALSGSVVVHDMISVFGTSMETGEGERVKTFFQQEGLSATERAKLNGDGNKTVYAWRHSELSGVVQSTFFDLGISDIILTNNEQVLFTSTKSADFLEPFSNSDLSILKEVVEKVYANVAEKNTEVVKVGLRDYPIAKEKSFFFSMPVFGKYRQENDPPIGTIIFRVGEAALAGMLQFKSDKQTSLMALLETDGSIIAGSDIGTEMEAIPTAPAVDTPDTIVENEITINENVPVLAATTIVSLAGYPMRLISSIETQEAFAGIANMRNVMIVTAIAVQVILCVFGFFFARAISRPIAVLTEDMNVLAEGDRETTHFKYDISNETGAMAKALGVFRDNAVEQHRLSEERKVNHIARDKRQATIEGLIEEFRSEVAERLAAVSSVADNMEDTANMLSDATIKTSTESENVAQSSKSASENVRSVASASEELSASIQEIMQRIHEANAVIANCNEKAGETDKRIGGLAESARRIGDVVNLISEIAEQTNLLALNATIEAARAGEAGRGFAVVASEVKALASQTSKATDEISQQVTQIQTETSQAVESVQQITTIMADIDSQTATILNSVQQQEAATADISRHSGEAAHTTDSVAKSIDEISESIQTNRTQVQNVVSASDEIGGQANSLQQQVNKFLDSVAAA